MLKTALAFTALTSAFWGVLALGAPGSRPKPPAPHAAAPDGRAPLLLLPMMAEHQKASMRDHLAAVHDVLAALQAHDLPAVEKAGARLGTTEEMRNMCNHMGAATPGFTDRALAFHQTADGIGQAARARDEVGVMTALTATLATCVGCHAAFRQEVVDPATWEKAVGKPAPVPGGHHHGR